jgi:hypothetical protein
VYYSRGLLNLNDLDDKNRAVVDFSKYIEMNPKDKEGYFRRSEVWRKMKLI